ncbi:MAG: hypothetical protein SFY95_11600 [Planctomycetota bacterium]|nr:hypothetical protein [Planctomycetota bacterium]
MAHARTDTAQPESPSFAFPDTNWPSNSLVRGVIGLVSASAYAIEGVLERRGVALPRAGLPWGVRRALKVGVGLPKPLAGLLTGSVGLGGAGMGESDGLEFCTLSQAGRRALEGDEAGRAVRGLGLDAAIISEEGDGATRFRIIAAEAPGAATEAGWFDWAEPRPLALHTLFARRVDPAQVTLPASAFEPGSVGLTRALVDLAALLARHDERLTTADRLAGRAPVCQTARERASESMFEVRREADLIFSAFSALARRVEQARAGEVAQIAARVVASYAAGLHAGEEAGAEGAVCSFADRRALIERVDRGRSEDPVVLLALTAARLDDLADEHAIQAAGRAWAAMHSATLPDRVGVQDAILESASEAGGGAVGLFGAGLVMLHAAAEPDRRTFLREDLCEDLRFSARFIELEQECATLERMLRELDRLSAAQGSRDTAGSLGADATARAKAA